jgi:uncharacterized RDD family membrane protein YckC
VLALIISCGYFTFFIGRTGQTPGKKLMGIKVIRTDGKHLSYTKSLLRWFGYFLSFSVFFLGFVWIIFDRKKQGWHDKLVDSKVVIIDF